MAPEPVVYIVDDDDAVRRFVSGLVASVDLHVQAFASAREFLDTYENDRPGCLLLDMRMPGMSGLELQRELSKRAIKLPVIIITAYGDVPAAVQAMKMGAFDFIEKPFNNQALLDRVQAAVFESTHSGGSRLTKEGVTARFQTLTNRENQVLDLVVAGETNKSIARQLDISPRTVENHRARVMEKTGARSLAELVRMVAILEID
jgi:two-component system, LuxR family, response regulator FixJ